MATVKEIVGEITSVRQSTDNLAIMVGNANMELASEASVIASLVHGSRTGGDAVNTLLVATRALANAVSSMKALSKTCDECISNLEK